MRRTLVAAAGALALGAPAALGALAGGTPGVSASTILLGGTAPLSGPLSQVSGAATGATAYFKYVNAHGGVLGRKVQYEILDDAFDPAQTVQQTRQLVQQDGVLAVFDAIGTDQNLATAPYLNSAGVPQLFIATGVNSLPADAKRYPWTVGYAPSYRAEGAIYGRYLAKARPRARIAVLFQDDEAGHDLIDGLRKGLGSHAEQIVAVQGFDPLAVDVQSQMAKLAESKADTLMNFAVPKQAIQAYVFASKLGWQPATFVASYSSASNILTLTTLATSKRQTEGTVSIVFIKDPTDPQWASDPAVKLYRQILRRYDAHADWKDVYNVYGMAVGYTMVDALRHAGKDPTRQSVLNAALHLNERNPFLPPGIVIRTTPADRFPIHQARLQRWHAGRWIPFGPVLPARG